MLNFNQERLKLNDAVTQLQNQISGLKADFERYRQSPKYSEKFGFFKEQQIKILESVVESFNEYSDNTNLLFIENQKEVAKLKNRIFKLEGICLLHGISNMGYYLRMRTQVLVYIVKQAFNEKWRQTPFDLHGDQNNEPSLPVTVTKPIVSYIDLKNKALEK